MCANPLLLILQHVLVVDCPDATDELGTGTGSNDHRFANSIVLQSDWDGNFLQVHTNQRKTNVNTGICLNGFYSDGIGKGNISYGYWKDISSGASGRRKDEAWENIE